MPAYRERTGELNEDVEYSEHLIANVHRIRFDTENPVWPWNESYYERVPNICRRHRELYPICSDFTRLVN
jgi:hypothetical protein